MKETVLYVAASEADARSGAAALEDAGPLAVEPAVSLEKVERYAAGVDCVVFAETPTTAAGAHLLEVVDATGSTPLVLYSEGEYGPTTARSTDGIDGYVRREGERSIDHLADEIVWVCTDVRTERETVEHLHELVTAAEDCSESEKQRLLERASETAAALLGSADCAFLFLENGSLRRRVGTGTARRDQPLVAGIASEAMASGEPILIDDLRDHPLADGEFDGCRSVIAVPLEAEGVFRAVADCADAFSRRDLELAEVLVSHVSAVIERRRAQASVDSERDRVRELTARNERLEEFASIVSHDLRNPLNVAEGYLELATETGDGAHLREVETAHERMRELLERLLTLARRGDVIADTEPVAIHDIARRAWNTVETGEATLEFGEDTILEADKARLIEVFENLCHNAVEHGSTSPRSHPHEGATEHGTEDGGVTVRVGALEDGFFFEDDGVGIPENDRETVFESGYTTAPDGTGYGLDIVEQIAEAHGWDVAVCEGKDGGARFAFTGVETDALETGTDRDGPSVRNGPTIDM